jgi:hypothetical protein
VSHSYNNTQQIEHRALFNRHRGNTNDQITAILNKIAKLNRELSNTRDQRIIVKHNNLINSLYIRLADLANPRS